ncbi:hypothetical protein PAMP_006405 [Pampus punctatissimus]
MASGSDNEGVCGRWGAYYYVRFSKIKCTCYESGYNKDQKLKGHGLKGDPYKQALLVFLSTLTPASSCIVSHYN